MFLCTNRLYVVFGGVFVSYPYVGAVGHENLVHTPDGYPSQLLCPWDNVPKAQTWWCWSPQQNALEAE
jgi:hypothetical protein